MSTTTLYLDQNYLSAVAKDKPAFRELAPVLREAINTRAVMVLESEVHELESKPRPDLNLMTLLHELSKGHKLETNLDRAARDTRRRMTWIIEHELPARRARSSDAADLDALAQALVHCRLVTTDAFMPTSSGALASTSATAASCSAAAPRRAAAGRPATSPDRGP